MTIQIFDAILAFPVDGFVQFLPDDCALLLRSRVMGIYIGDNHGKHLRSKSERGRRFRCIAGTVQHDGCLAQAHLDTAHRIAIAKVLGEAENPREPFAGSGDAAVNNMGNHAIAGDRSILHSDSMQRQSGVRREEIMNRATAWEQAAGE